MVRGRLATNLLTFSTYANIGINQYMKVNALQILSTVAALRQADPSGTQSNWHRHKFND